MRQVSRAEKGCNQILLYGVIAIIAGFFYGGFSDIRRYAEIELTGTPHPPKAQFQLPTPTSTPTPPPTATPTPEQMPPATNGG